MASNTREFHRIAEEIRIKTEPEYVRKVLAPLGIGDESIIVGLIQKQRDATEDLLSVLQREAGKLPKSQLQRLRNLSTIDRSKKMLAEYTERFKYVFEEKLCSPQTAVCIGLALGVFTGARMAAEDVLKHVPKK